MMMCSFDYPRAAQKKCTTKTRRTRRSLLCFALGLRVLRVFVVNIIGAAMLDTTSVAAMPIHLVPNRATYDLQLEHTSPGGAVAARGRMVVQFRDACDGWSTAQRMVADLTGSDGAISRSDFLVTAWESKDGKSMRFDVENASGSKLDREKRGNATLAGDGGAAVSLLAPARREFALPAGTIFPTAQTEALVAAATRGQANVKRVVFEGGDEGDTYVSTAVIGRPVSSQATMAEHAVDSAGLIRNVPAWTVLVSYFDNKRGADLPEYEIATRLYANGISGSMSLVYSRYTLRATLTRLEPLVPSCPAAQNSDAKAETAKQ
jgi:hypothetical protein